MRQKTNQKKTLFYLEQILLKYNATKDCVGIKTNHGKKPIMRDFPAAQKNEFNLRHDFKRGFLKIVVMKRGCMKS